MMVLISILAMGCLVGTSVELECDPTVQQCKDCPSDDMKFVLDQAGGFCIDGDVRQATEYYDGVDTCLDEGLELCTVSQYERAIQEGYEVDAANGLASVDGGPTCGCPCPDPCSDYDGKSSTFWMESGPQCECWDHPTAGPAEFSCCIEL
jgi:hypothetical protein